MRVFACQAFSIVLAQLGQWHLAFASWELPSFLPSEFSGYSGCRGPLFFDGSNAIDHPDCARQWQEARTAIDAAGLWQRLVGPISKDRQSFSWAKGMNNRVRIESYECPELDTVFGEELADEAREVWRGRVIDCDASFLKISPGWGSDTAHAVMSQNLNLGFAAKRGLPRVANTLEIKAATFFGQANWTQSKSDAMAGEFLFRAGHVDICSSVLRAACPELAWKQGPFPAVSVPGTVWESSQPGLGLMQITGYEEILATEYWYSRSLHPSSPLGFAPAPAVNIAYHLMKPSRSSENMDSFAEFVKDTRGQPNTLDSLVVPALLGAFDQTAIVLHLYYDLGSWDAERFRSMVADWLGAVLQLVEVRWHFDETEFNIGAAFASADVALVGGLLSHVFASVMPASEKFTKNFGGMPHQRARCHRTCFSTFSSRHFSLQGPLTSQRTLPNLPEVLECLKQRCSALSAH